MAYVKNIWVDQDVERPKTYEVTNNQDGSITLTDSFGLVTELGTPVNEVNMNHIEDGIAGCAIRKHNLTETFALGEWVLGGTGDNEGFYKSLIADNVGNAITDDTAWEKVEMGGGSSRNIGEIVASTIPLTDAGLHLLDGSLIQGSGSYSAFVDYIAGLVTDYPDLFVTESDWQTAITTYGSCGKFVYDSVNNTVRLPKISDILQGTTDLTAIGDLVEAGLPNITGQISAFICEKEVIGHYNADATGAFTATIYDTTVSSQGSGNNSVSIGFDASHSSSIYGNSSTVQPQTIKVLYYIVIATTTKTDIQVDIDEIATDLNGKADTDLTNCTDVANIKMAHNAMPSNTYIDLTLGASGSTYTAPADGWFYVNKIAGADWHYVIITNTSKVSTGYSDLRANYRTSTLTPMLPVQKGDVVEIEYNATGATQAFKFIYAQGSEKEAN